jgi:hypothetical protein
MRSVSRNTRRSRSPAAASDGAAADDDDDPDPDPDDDDDDDDSEAAEFGCEEPDDAGASAGKGLRSPRRPGKASGGTGVTTMGGADDG